LAGHDRRELWSLTYGSDGTGYWRSASQPCKDAVAGMAVAAIACGDGFEWWQFELGCSRLFSCGIGRCSRALELHEQAQEDALKRARVLLLLPWLGAFLFVWMLR
jgi:hypothetical protein